MCSILAMFDLAGDAEVLRRRALALSRRQRHRGPDWSGIWADDEAVLAHERLAIVDLESGGQPILSSGERIVLAVNGEIYNHRELEGDLTLPYTFGTKSDCEVISALWLEEGPQFLSRLNGIFAFSLWDRQEKRYLVARDPVGVCPLYIGRDEEGTLHVASEMKALYGVCPVIEPFPPGHYLDSRIGHPVPFWSPSWRDYDSTAGVVPEVSAIREGLEAAVHRQLMSDVPYGVLLSGGLDSSIIAACAAKFARRRVEDDDRSEAWWPRLHSFSIGLRGSPDLEASRVVASALGTVHHALEFTIQEGIDALSEVIHHIETFDVTTVRASTPMYLMARRIRSMGVKMVLSGEGADEIFGGYLYFHKAPGSRDFHEETVRKIDLLHHYDCLRANKSMAAWGVEARVPFLDLEFLELAMRFDAQHKMTGAAGIEKRILREAFRDALPHEILWRQKEQFSDGVGYGWIDALKELAARSVSDGDLARAAARFPVNPPRTKEAYLYRRLFDEHFPGDAAARAVHAEPSIACSSTVALSWDAAFLGNHDPSGRAVRDVHRAGVDHARPEAFDTTAGGPS
jgi:asparagine synthase (glutamine-hydrolysing)